MPTLTQVAAFHEAMRELDPSIPLVLQPGNHDVGQNPSAGIVAEHPAVALLTRALLTRALLARALFAVALLTRALLTRALLTRALLATGNVAEYCARFGDDYFSFWVGGVKCVPLHSH